MFSKRRISPTPRATLLVSVLFAFAALLPAFPVSADGAAPWSDAGSTGVGSSVTAGAGAGRSVLCRATSDPTKSEGWGVLVETDRMATSQELNEWLTSGTAINALQDASRPEGATHQVRGVTWSWVKLYRKWREPVQTLLPHGTKYQYGGPRGKEWTRVVPPNDGFSPLYGSVWVNKWYEAGYANCDPVRCPGGSCSSTRFGAIKSPVLKWCLKSDIYEERFTTPRAMVGSKDLTDCRTGGPELTPFKLCQTHWEVWRFYGEKGNPASAYISGSGKASYSVSRIPLLGSVDCAMPDVTVNQKSRNETIGVFLSPHPWDSSSGLDQLPPGQGVIDDGYARRNGYNEEVLRAPSNTTGGLGFTTLPPFRSKGSCTTLVSTDSPYAGDSEEARQLRKNFTDVIKAQGYSEQFARLAANADAAGNWGDGVPCSSGAEFARPFAVVVKNDAIRPVYGTCWVPVWQARFGQVNPANVVSYSPRNRYLFRYGSQSRPILKVTGSADDIDRFAAYARTRQSSVVVVSVDLPVQSDSSAITTKSMYITVVSPDSSTTKVTPVDLQNRVQALWSESGAQSNQRFKVSGSASYATASPGERGLEHHARWRDAIGMDVEKRFREHGGNVATTEGTGVGLPVNRNFSNQDWVPADAYATSNDMYMTQFTDSWDTLRVNSSKAAADASKAAVCVDGPLASGDIAPVVAPAAQVEIASKVTLPSTTINPAWSIDQCEPAESTDEKVRDESAAACLEFDKLSPADKANVLKFPSTTPLAQKKFDAYIRVLLTQNPSASIPDSVDLGEVVQVEYVSARNPSAKGTIAISAVVAVDRTKCPPGSTLAECVNNPPPTTTTTTPSTPDAECPGTCAGSLPRVTDRPSATVTLVVPRTFATGAGMTSKQKVTAVVHDLNDEKVCDGVVGSSTGRVSGGNTGGSDVITGCRPWDHEMTLRLTISAVGGFSQVKIDPNSTANNTVLSGCNAAGLRASFEANYANTACSRSFEMEFYRASAAGDGVASTVAASGRISRQVMVTIRYPRACLAQIIQDINALLGSVNVSAACNFPSNDGIERDMSLAEYAIPGWRNLGWSGIGFTVRVVFEEDVANADAHDSLLSACGTASIAPSLPGSKCTLRPVISTSATGKR